MGTKYSSQATSGYNSSPPADDGSTTEANKIKWATIKTKLADVLKTFAEAINTALVTAFDQSCRTVAASDSAAATDHNRTIQVTTSSVTITLADATTMAAGYIVSVANQSSGNVSVALATSTDTIDGVTNTTQVIHSKEVRRYIVNTAATGYITASQRTVPGQIPQNSQSAAYTTVLADAGRHILHPTADNNARTFTIDSNANVPYAIGTAITFVNEINTVTIAITSDTMTLAGAGTTGSRTLAANGIATVLKVSSTGWVISGTGLT